MKTQRGITLIALIITIIVMLILVGVSVSVALNTGLFKAAQQAARETEQAKQDEVGLSAGLGGIFTLPEELKIGDYVAYEYTPATYKDVILNEGDEQLFNSGNGGNAEITKWRVLNIENGVVQLVAEGQGTDQGLIICGENGYLKGSSVLNDMCAKLYSGKYGTARSINLDDLFKAEGTNDAARYYTNASGTKTGITAETTGMDTIGEIVEAENYDMSLIGTKMPGNDNGDVGSIKYDYYQGRMDSATGAVTSDSFYPFFKQAPTGDAALKRDVLFNEWEIQAFWLADTTTLLRLNHTQKVTYRQYFISGHLDYRDNNGRLCGLLQSSNLYNSIEGLEEGYKEDAASKAWHVRPIVELNIWTAFDGKDASGAWILK